MPDTTFVVKATVNQVVTKQVSLEVSAENEQEAMEKSREALQTYPDKVEVEGITRIQTTGIDHWIPRDIEFVSVHRQGKEIA